MIISKAIRYFAERLGIKTTGTGISDAIMDLADNFPFGKRVEEKVVMDGTYEVSEKHGAISWVYVENFTESITEGSKYVVNINDKTYEVVAKIESGNLIIGDYGIFDAVESGEFEKPFIFGKFYNGSGDVWQFRIDNSVVPTLDGTSLGNYKVSIKLVDETITPLPAEFLPEGIGGGSEVLVVEFNVENEDSETEKLTVSHTTTEIREAYKQGKTIIGKRSSGRTYNLSVINDSMILFSSNLYNASTFNFTNIFVEMFMADSLNWYRKTGTITVENGQVKNHYVENFS